MMMVACAHAGFQKYGKTKRGEQRYRCNNCGHVWFDATPRLLGPMTVPVDDAKLALWLLVGGVVDVIGGPRDRDTLQHVNQAHLFFGDACRRFLDRRMRGLTLDHLEFDEQSTSVLKKHSRLTIEQREGCHDIGDVYIWTCIDRTTKLLPAFRLVKRTADNARRFALEVASRLNLSKPHASDNHAFAEGAYRPVVQVGTNGFPGYPEARGEPASLANPANFARRLP